MGRVPKLVVALAGPPSSGKSSVAASIGAEWQAPVLGFGDYVRQEASSRGLTNERGALQDLGQELLEKQGAEEFCRSVLAAQGRAAAELPVIWDGVRHLPVLEALRRIYAPAPVVLAYLQPPESTRRERVLDRAESEAASPEQWAAHQTESHLNELKRRADLVVLDQTPALAAATLKRAILG
jgi:adenylate kinase family enzyme